MTFTMEETAFLAEKGFDDFIVSYPTVQPTDLDLFAGLIRAGKTVSLVVDSEDHLERLSRTGEREGVVLGACMLPAGAALPDWSSLFFIAQLLYGIP